MDTKSLWISCQQIRRIMFSRWVGIVRKKNVYIFLSLAIGSKSELIQVNITCRTLFTLLSLRDMLHHTLHKKVTIQQVTTMLATSKNVPFPGHNHLLTTGTDGPTLIIAWRLSDNQSVGSSVPVVSRWLWPGNRTLLEVASRVVTW